MSFNTAQLFPSSVADLKISGIYRLMMLLFVQGIMNLATISHIFSKL